MSRKHLNRLTIAILLLGFAGGLIAYIAAAPAPENPFGYNPLETKKFRHDLELYGGKANVLAAEFREWFFGLWYGRNLAYSIWVITLLIVVAVRYLASGRDTEPLRLIWEDFPEE